MENFDELANIIARAEETPFGKTSVALWSQAIDLAEEREDIYTQVYCYYSLISALVMSGDSSRVIAPFLRVRQLREKHREVFDEHLISHLCWTYKYVIGTCASIPTVSVDQWAGLLEEMRRDYLEVGDGLSAYYYRLYRFYDEIGDNDKAEEAFGKWQSAPRTELSDCQHCEPEHLVVYYGSQDQWDQAVAIGEKTLASNEEFCDSQPESLLTYLMIPYLHVGRDDKAWEAHVRAYRRYQASPRYLGEITEHLRYLAISSQAGRPERKERALNILLRHLPWWPEAEFPRTLQHLAASGVTVLSAFDEADRDRILEVTLPGDELSWISSPRLVNPTMAEALDWFREVGDGICERFANRPGHPDPQSVWDRYREFLEWESVPEIESSSEIPDVTGLFDPWTPQTILNEPAAEPAKSGEPSPGGASTSAHEDPPLPPVSLAGPWRTMDYAQALKLSSTHPGMTLNIYGLKAADYQVSRSTNPNRFFHPWSLLAKDEDDPMSTHSDTHGGASARPDVAISADVEPGGAYALLAEALEANYTRDHIAAGLTADRAMRAPAEEPLGVRLAGLLTMALAAEGAGYPREAITSMREVVNLAAALGLRGVQIDAAAALAEMLHKADRNLEASEVAQSALELLFSYVDNYNAEIALRAILAKALEELSDYATAAEHRMRLAEIYAARGDSLAQIRSNTMAVLAYLHAEKHSEACQSANQLLQVARGHYEAEKDNYELASPQPSSEDTERFQQSISRFSEALYCASRALAQCPGQLDSDSLALMEARMQELFALFAHWSVLPDSTQSREWLEADWHDDLSTMYWWAEYPLQAIDAASRSIEAFGQINHIGDQIRVMIRQAQMYSAIGDVDQARTVLLSAREILSEHGDALQDHLQAVEQLLDTLDEDFEL